MRTEEPGATRVLEYPTERTDLLECSRSAVGGRLAREVLHRAPRAARWVRHHRPRASVGARISSLAVPVRHERRIGTTRIDVEDGDRHSIGFAAVVRGTVNSTTHTQGFVDHEARLPLISSQSTS